jgi:hypothetical protein
MLPVLLRVGPAGGGCYYLPGDINGDGQANGLDVVFGVAFFKGGNLPPTDCAAPTGPCPQSGPFYAAGDANGGCQFNGVDLTYYVAYLKGLQHAILYCPTCPPAGQMIPRRRIGESQPSLEIKAKGDIGYSQ